MHPDRLFLRRCKQINELSTSHDEVDLLDLSGHLRQILLDKANLVDLAKKNKIKLIFYIGQFSQPVRDGDVIYSLEDGIDPETRASGMPSANLNFDAFLAHTIMYVQQKPMTIRLVIGYAANAAGGVHYDPIPKAQYERLHIAAQHVQLGGLPLSIRSLQAIARVTLRGLQPLITDVESRQI